MKNILISMSLLTLLTACASSPEKTESAGYQEGYVPTGSNIPRKKVGKTGGTDVMSQEQAEAAMKSGAPLSNGQFSR